MQLLIKLVLVVIAIIFWPITLFCLVIYTVYALLTGGISQLFDSSNEISAQKRKIDYEEQLFRENLQKVVTQGASSNDIEVNLTKYVDALTIKKLRVPMIILFTILVIGVPIVIFPIASILRLTGIDTDLGVLLLFVIMIVLYVVGFKSLTWFFENQKKKYKCMIVKQYKINDYN